MALLETREIIKEEPLGTTAARRFATALASGYHANLDTPVSVSGLPWRERTKKMMEGGYGASPPLVQRSLHMLTHVANVFPHCATLEVMARSVVRARKVEPRSMARIFKRFQPQGESPASAIMTQGAVMLAMGPLLLEAKAPTPESTLLHVLIGILPTVIFASAKAATAEKKSKQSFKPEPRNSYEGVSHVAKMYHIEVDLNKFKGQDPKLSNADVVNRIRKR